MKKLISVVAILSLFSTFALSEIKIDGKIGLDISGSHKSTLSGSIDYIPIPSISSTKSSTDGFSISLEATDCLQPSIILGVGFTYQIPRSITAEGKTGNFNFIPIYGILKYKINPLVDIIGHLGYNLFNGDREYKGDASLQGGLYYGVGGELKLREFIISFFYSEHKGSFSQSGWISDGYYLHYYDLKGDVSYSKFTISIGITLK
jgi:hypothetical protein